MLRRPHLKKEGSKIASGDTVREWEVFGERETAKKQTNTQLPNESFAAELTKQLHQLGTDLNIQGLPEPAQLGGNGWVGGHRAQLGHQLQLWRLLHHQRQREPQWALLRL